jgi:hypothetical protein
MWAILEVGPETHAQPVADRGNGDGQSGQEATMLARPVLCALEGVTYSRPLPDTADIRRMLPLVDFRVVAGQEMPGSSPEKNQYNSW